MAPVAASIAGAGRRGGFLVAFLEYRPPLVRALAERLDLDFSDFRAEQLAALGWEAARLPLSALDQAIGDTLERSGSRPVLHNAEALPATKPAPERRDWLAALAATDRHRPVIFPVSVIQAEMPPLPRRTHRLNPVALPPESLLTRLASR